MSWIHLLDVIQPNCTQLLLDELGPQVKIAPTGELDLSKLNDEEAGWWLFCLQAIAEKYFRQAILEGHLATMPGFVRSIALYTPISCDLASTLFRMHTYPKRGPLGGVIFEPWSGAGLNYALNMIRETSSASDTLTCWQRKLGAAIAWFAKDPCRQELSTRQAVSAMAAAGIKISRGSVHQAKTLSLQGVQTDVPNVVTWMTEASERRLVSELCLLPWRINRAPDCLNVISWEAQPKPGAAAIIQKDCRTLPDIHGYYEAEPEQAGVKQIKAPHVTAKYIRDKNAEYAGRRRI